MDTDKLREKIAEILLQVFNDGFVLGEIGVGNDQESTAKALLELIALFPDTERIVKELTTDLLENTNRKVEEAKREERERIKGWLFRPCPHTGGLEEQQLYVQDCLKCWQTLEEKK